MAVGGIGAWGIGSSIYNWGYRPYVNPYVMATPVVITAARDRRAARPDDSGRPAASEQRPWPPPVDYSQPLCHQRSAARSPPSPTRRSRPSTRAAPRSRRGIITRPSRRPTRRSRLCRMTRRSTSSGRFACSRSSSTTRRPAPSMRCCRPDRDGTGRRSAAFIRAWTSTPHRCGLWRTIALSILRVAPARFVLAYHYLTQGHTEAAVAELEEVVKLQPADQLSAQLLTQLSGDTAPESRRLPRLPRRPRPRTGGRGRSGRRAGKSRREAGRGARPQAQRSS